MEKSTTLCQTEEENHSTEQNPKSKSKTVLGPDGSMHEIQSDSTGKEWIDIGGVKKWGNIVTTAEFISRANKIHGDAYDYSAAKYTLTDSKLIIICKKHGQFSQRPNSHLRGSGCPKCGKGRISKSETAFLNHIGIPEEFRQYRIPTMRYQVDGFSLETNTIYEFLGDYWHGNPKIYSAEVKLHNSALTCGLVHTRTFNRFSKLSKLGYVIKYIWESDWKTWKKDKTQPLPIKIYANSSIQN